VTANPFEQAGADYARHRPDYPPELVAALAAECAGNDHALDVGCGNGQLTVALAEAFARVTGTDASVRQIAAAAPHPRVTYRVESAEQIGEPDASVDLIVAAQAAHWFDLEKFYPEARRVLKPRGVVALVSYGVPELDGPVGRAFHDFYWGSLHRFWPSERGHVEQGYSRLPFPFRETGIEGIEIRRSWGFDDLAGYVGTWSAAKAATAAGAALEWADALHAVGEVWEHRNDRRLVRWKVTARIGRV
jgi:SAM-dependent methyltransferase